MSSRLAQPIKKTKLREPARICFYGPEGIGKSTLAAAAPDPIWNDIEAGSGQLSVARYPYRDDATGHRPNTFEEFDAGIDDLIVAPHDYKTLVIDTGDSLEKLIHRHIVKRDKVKPNKNESAPGIHSYGFGKGFDVAVDELRALTIKLDRLRHERGMQVIILAHMQIAKYKSPTSDSYDRFTMRMNEKAASFLREWCDVVGFCCYEDTVSNQFDDERNRGVTTGRRLIRFKREATHDAKSRYALPDSVEMGLTDPWAPFAKALSEAQDMTADQLVTAIEAECARVGDDVATERARKYVKEAAGDTTVLQRVLEKMREKMPVNNETKGVQ